LPDAGRRVQVNGPFFVQLLGSFQDKECVYLVMEFVAGGELFTYLQRHGRCAVQAPTRRHQGPPACN
jgi:serine/threonine protein kinase